MILGKNITLDYAGMGPVARYETILVPPSDSANSQFEIPTGYLRAEFDRFWTYDAGLEELSEVSPAPMSNTAVSFSPESGFGGVVIADSSLTHAMGAYGGTNSARPLLSRQPQPCRNRPRCYCCYWVLHVSRGRTGDGVGGGG